MSRAIKGHGRRDLVQPYCKCGWRGTPATPEESDRQYEQHKAKVRKDLNIADPAPSRAPGPSWKRRLEVVR